VNIRVRSTTSTTTGLTPPRSWPLRRSPQFEGIDRWVLPRNCAGPRRPGEQ
jgi:hypothetical protein